MSEGENIYQNAIPNREENQKPQKSHLLIGSRKKHGFLSLICIAILLFSLMSNVILAYFYCKLKWAQVTVSETIGNCSAGEAEHQHVIYKERVYILFSDKMNWDSSRISCQKLGGDLAIIKSKEEHDLISGLVSKIASSLFWIGLTDAENEGVWLWIDGTPLNKNLSWWKYTPDDWKQNNPLGEDCVVYYEGEWADVSCLTSYMRICEIFLNSSNSTF
ncbi:hypothetical protein Q7C36_017613 [Tachysurus vachellii]|uniref:C-type lectin domain-containing protein n=1 Tax=Tachysurus vachellii TaxID=175792 RepID=A0AA88M391_TACVA|nr:hepatic lectin-like [Tachysurus vachellii]KAK2829623.1 hypothetical protein Q7C36_017613 [Tachysurus vachellii]